MRNRRRGSAMLFAVVMVSLMTIGILASVQLSSSAASLQSKREAEAKARYAFDGAVQMCLTELRAATTNVPLTKHFIVGEHDVTLNVLDNSTSVARTLFATGTLKVQGREYRFTRRLGNSLDPHPFFYALFTNSQLDPLRPMTFGSAGSLGDVMFNGGVVTRANAFVVNGDFESTTTNIPIGATVSGNTLRQARNVPMPAFNVNNYDPGLVGGLLNTVLQLLGSIVGMVFPAVEPYRLVYRNGNLNLSGNFTGKGTIVVNGDVTITGNMTYADADSRLVVIASGKITLAAAVNSYVGYFYTPVEFVTSANAATLTRGGIAAQKLTVAGPVTVHHDSSFWLNPSDMVKHRVPGYWP